MANTCNSALPKFAASVGKIEQSFVPMSMASRKASQLLFPPLHRTYPENRHPIKAAIRVPKADAPNTKEMPIGADCRQSGAN